MRRAWIDIWKWSLQSRISFYKFFFDKKHSNPPSPSHANIYGRDWRPPSPPSQAGTHFFSDPPFFKSLDWRCPPAEKGCWYGKNTVADQSYLNYYSKFWNLDRNVFFGILRTVVLTGTCKYSLQYRFYGLDSQNTITLQYWHLLKWFVKDILLTFISR